jgi:hypothetical protein
MNIVFAVISLLLSFLSAFYLLFPTFFTSLGYGWLHQYDIKRWALRSFALICLFVYILNQKEVDSLFIINLFIFSIFWIFSLFNASPNVFVALNESTILKVNTIIYPLENEVIGIVDEDGFAICYPIDEMVLPRHLLNDIFQNKSLLISFCAACRSTMIFNSCINGERLTFEVISVYRRNMVIRDLQTGTIWQQIQGKAMYGKLKGTQLEFLPYQQTSLKEWMKQYPNSLIAKEVNVKKGIFPKSFLSKILLKVTNNLTSSGKTNLKGLPLREKIWGVEFNGKTKAYPINELNKLKNNDFEDIINGMVVKIQYNHSSNKISGYVVSTNEKLTFQRHWWLGWKEFYPNTEIWCIKTNLID